MADEWAALLRAAGFAERDLDTGAASLDHALASARAAHPAIAVDEARFVTHVLGFTDGQLAALASLRTVDLYVAFASAEGDARAIRHVEDTELDSARAHLRRMRLDDDDAAEVLQLARQRLLLAADAQPARMRSYAGRAPLSAWLRVVVGRVALNWLRARGRSDAPRALEPESLGAGPGPELAALRARYAEAFAEAFREAFAALDTEQRLLLKQHFLDGMPTAALAKLYRLHRVSVLRRLEAARDVLRTGIEQRLIASCQLSGSELESVLRLVRSQLDVSLRSTRP